MEGPITRKLLNPLPWVVSDAVRVVMIISRKSQLLWKKKDMGLGVKAGLCADSSSTSVQVIM